MITVLVYIAIVMMIVSVGYTIKIFFLAKGSASKKEDAEIFKENQSATRIVRILFIIFMIAAIWVYYATRV